MLCSAPVEAVETLEEVKQEGWQQEMWWKTVTVGEDTKIQVFVIASMFCRTYTSLNTDHFV